MANKPTKQATHKIGDYDLISDFAGYNARLDRTLLPPNTLIYPSQNVLIGTSKRLSLVKGYELDGDASTTIDSGIVSNVDFTPIVGGTRNLRAGFMSVAANDGKLQYRYADSAGTVTWRDLKIGLTSLTLSFAEFWNNTQLQRKLLWVDGSNNFFEWNGAITTLASATANTVTKQGTTTWAEQGFTATGSIVIGGVPATYTGGSTTTTLTGVSVDFSNTGTYPVASPIHQEVVTTALSAMTNADANFDTFGPTVIGCGRRNQLYVGSSKSNLIYISKMNDYTDYSYSSPNRKYTEGKALVLNAPPIAFVAQENKDKDENYDLYISEGKDLWGVVSSQLSSDNVYEELGHIILKTSPFQGAISERLVTKMKNHIVYVGNDKVANFFGYRSYQYVPVLLDFSYPIIDDMNSYDFTGASIFYHKNFIYIAIPAHGLIRVYNMTDQSKQQNQYSVEQVDQQPFYWEAPIGYPISGFYVVDGELYGHNSTTSESYKLFSSGSFNGQDIEAIATFAYDPKADRTQTKGSDEIYVEGYIKQNTDINVTVSGDLDYCQVSQTKIIDGNDSTTVCFGGGGGAFGKNPLGSEPLGGSTTAVTTLPAWFHVIKTYPQVPFYLEQVSFYTKGTDLQWELITFGTKSQNTSEGNNWITQ